MEPLRELGELIMRRATSHGVWSDEPLGLIFSTATCTSQPVRGVYTPAFALLAQGEKQLVLGDKLFTGGKGTFLVVSVELPVTYRISRASPEEPYIALALTLNPRAIATLLLEAASVDRDGIAPQVAGIGASEAPADLLESVVRLVRLLDHPRDRPILGPMAEREVLWRLMFGDQGHSIRQIGLADSRLSQIGRAMRWMREHYREALRIEDLARLSAMSVTSFHRHFRAIALMSPMQYLKLIRLQEARARLLARADDVAAVGHAVGYDSPSQFSREYKRAYGSPPGQDARMLRTSSTKI